jgi:hypothetical protein
MECRWLIGCAVWDYQKIKHHQFDNRFYFHWRLPNMANCL